MRFVLFRPCVRASISRVLGPRSDSGVAQQEAGFHATSFASHCRSSGGRLLPVPPTFLPAYLPPPPPSAVHFSSTLTLYSARRQDRSREVPQ